MQRAVSFLLRDQTAEGAWYGRWGVNYVYGTSGVLRALETVALDGARLLPARGRVAALGAKCRRRIRRIHRFLLRRQAQGPRREHAVADGLGTDRLAGRRRTATIPLSARAVAHLVEQQNADGSWDEDEFTGTGFPVRVLSEISSVSELFPAVRAGALSQPGSQVGSEFRAFRDSSRKRRSGKTPHEGEDEISAEDDRESGEVRRQQALSRRRRNSRWS